MANFFESLDLVFFTLLCGKGEFENAPKGGPLWPNFFEVIILVVLVTNYDTD